MARSSNGATIQLYVGDFAPLHALNFHPQFWCQHLKFKVTGALDSAVRGCS